MSANQQFFNTEEYYLAKDKYYRHFKGLENGIKTYQKEIFFVENMKKGFRAPEVELAYEDAKLGVESLKKRIEILKVIQKDGVIEELDLAFLIKQPELNEFSNYPNINKTTSPAKT